MTPTSNFSTPPREATLRERKRRRTRRDLQRAAIRLVEARGYENTSVDDICEEAETSRSTFFRHFGTKAAVFEADLVEEQATDRWGDLPEYSLDVLRDLICDGYERLTDEEFDQERRRIHLLQTIPELRASFAHELVRPLPVLLRFASRMLDLPPDTQRVRTLAGMIFGVLATMQLPDDHGHIELPATKAEAIAMFEAAFAELALAMAAGPPQAAGPATKPARGPILPSRRSQESV